MRLFVLNYAIKSISRRKRKNIGGILAIALGVTLLIGVQSGISGIRNSVGAEYWTSLGNVDITIENPSGEYFNQSIQQRILESQSSSMSTLQTIDSRIVYDLPLYSKNNGLYEPSIRVIGITPENDAFGQFYDENENVLHTTDLLQDTSILINAEVEKLLSVSPGDTLIVNLPQGNGEYKEQTLSIRSIFSSEISRGRENSMNSQPLIYANIALLQSVLASEYKDMVNVLELVFSDVTKSYKDLNLDHNSFPGSKTIEDNISFLNQFLTDDGLIARSDRFEVVNAIEDEVGGIESTMNMFVILLNATALLLIINVQTLSLRDRQEQTAVLRSMGSPRRQITMIFLIESGIVGIVGSIVGIGFGILYGRMIQNLIANIFQFNNSLGFSLQKNTLGSAFLLGISLSVITAIIPSIYASSRSITDELRGIETNKLKARNNYTGLLGFLLFISGLIVALRIGKFWTKEGWEVFDNQVLYLISFGLLTAGIGFMVTKLLNAKIGMNITAVSIYSSALFVLFITFAWGKYGDDVNWFSVNMSYLILGTVLLVITNFELIMNSLHRFLGIFPRLRAISQVSTREMVGKKGQLTLIYTIFAILLIMNIFIASAAYTVLNSNIREYEFKSQGVDLVVSTAVASNQTADFLSEIEDVTEVFGFRSYLGPVYTKNPLDPSFDANKDITYKNIVEVDEQIMKPNNQWDNESLSLILFELFQDNINKFSKNMDDGVKKERSQELMDEFFTGHSIQETTYSGENPEEKNVDFQMIIGDYFTDKEEDSYLFFPSIDQSDSVIETYTGGTVFSMMGAFPFLSGALLVTPSIAKNLPGFQSIQAPNLFLLRTSYGYYDNSEVEALSLKIEASLNNLDDPYSLSSSLDSLIGGSTRVVYDEVADFMETESDFWTFLSTFTNIGMIIGVAGMVIIAIRSVSDRKREIGMMRAIGFDRKTVVFTIALELSFISFIGLITGIVNGVIIAYAFSNSVYDMQPTFPLQTIGIYAIVLLILSVISGAIPGYQASKIAPSQALRYSG